MKLHTFEQLQKDEQEEVVWQQGVLLDERTEKGFTILLFQIHAFYVEVFYNIYLNEIMRLKSFSSPTYLQPYLEKMDVSDVFL